MGVLVGSGAEERGRGQLWEGGHVPHRGFGLSPPGDGLCADRLVDFTSATGRIIDLREHGWREGDESRGFEGYSGERCRGSGPREGQGGGEKVGLEMSREGTMAGHVLMWGLLG